MECALQTVMCMKTQWLAAVITVGLMACAVDTSDPLEPIDVSEDALAAGDDCPYECTIEGRAFGGEQIRVSCAGTHTVMMFCYSLEGECGPNPPNVGETVCLSAAPDGSHAQEVECQNDPCCKPCEDDPVEAIE